MPNIKTLVDAGFILEPEAVEILETIKSEDVELIKNAMNKSGKFIISKKDVEDFLSTQHLSGVQQQNNYSIEIIRSLDSYLEKNGRMSILDYAKRFLTRLQAIQKMLVQKIENSPASDSRATAYQLKDIVSISNAFGGSVIIGIVFRKDTDFFELEDQTGIIKVFSSGQKEMLDKIELDDIIAVKGVVGHDKTMKCEEIFFPDMPLAQPKTTKERIKIAFIDEHHQSEAGVKIIWNEDECRCVSAEKTMLLTDSCIFSVNGINVLYYSGSQNPIDILKRRFIALKKGDFIIDPAPDIFLSRGLQKPMNYKSVSIIPLNHEIDLCTREVTAK